MRNIMKKIMLIFMLVLFGSQVGFNALALGESGAKLEIKENDSVFKPTKLTVENALTPLAVSTQSPRLGYQMEGNGRNVYQTHYQILVSKTKDNLDNNRGEMWDSGKVASENNYDIIYDGSELESDTDYFWKVRVWLSNGNVTEYSDVATFTTGLLHDYDWDGTWIGQNADAKQKRFTISNAKWIWTQGEDKGDMGVPVSPNPYKYFRKTFNISRYNQVSKVIIHMNVDGQLECYFNGQHIATKKSFDSDYITIDLTQLAVEGENTIACRVKDDGYFRGFIANTAVFYNFGMFLEYPTDASWVTFEDNNGELKDFNAVKFDDSKWKTANVVDVYGNGPWFWFNVERPEPIPYEAETRVRKEFTLEDKKIARARLYICGLGYHYVYINGKRVGDHYLDPAQTTYDKRIYYVAHDVKDMLEKENAIGVELGKGFYDSVEHTEYSWDLAAWKDRPKCLLQLNITYEDGTTDKIYTDTSWESSMDGPMLYNGVFMGETYDARKEEPGWTKPNFKSKNKWQEAEFMNPPVGNLEGQMVEPIRVLEEVKPVKLIKTKTGYIFDMGILMAGWPKFTLKAKAGTTVKITAAERLKDEENFQFWAHNKTDGYPFTNYYTFKGEGYETYSPKYTYYGFRYIKIDGVTEDMDINLDSMVACRAATDVDKIGKFICSNELFNRLNKNMQRTLLMNFFAKLNDTPSYEKDQWGADIFLVYKSMLYNFDLKLLSEKTMNDIVDVTVNGDVPQIFPTMGWGRVHDPLWNGIIIGLPYELYRTTGNKEFIRKNYPVMKEYFLNEIKYLEAENNPDGTPKHKYLTYATMGDWCPPACNGHNHQMPSEGPAITCNAMVVEFFKEGAYMADLIGEHEDAKMYREWASKVTDAINKYFFFGDEYHTEITEYELNTGEMKEVGYRQTSQIMPLAFDLLPSVEAKTKVLNKLRNHLVTMPNGPHLNTGIAGTKYLWPTLTENGMGDLAYEIATQRTYPSYGYWLDNDINAFTEAWELTGRSYQHPFLGSIDEWFYEYLGGIYDHQNGYQELTIKPHILGDLTFAHASTSTVRGDLAVDWSLSGNTLSMSIKVPFGSKTTVYVPSDTNSAVSEIGGMKGVTYLGSIEGYKIFKVISGEYQFTSTYTK